MSPAGILCLDDDLDRLDFYTHWIPRAYLAHDVAGAIRTFNLAAPEICLIDYELGRGISSEPFAHHLASMPFNGRAIVVSESPFGWGVLKRILPAAEIVPFSVLRKRVEKSWAVSQTEIF